MPLFRSLLCLVLFGCSNGDKTAGHSSTHADHKSGDHEHADHKSGDHKPGDHKPGDHKSGDHEHADHKSGDHKSGDHKSGDHKSGDHKSGDHEHADHEHADHKPGDHKPHFDHRFEDADRWAKSFDDPEREAWQKPARVAELLAIGDGMVVADIGAGTGYFLAAFSKAVGNTGRVHGLDVEADMVRYMAKRAKAEGLANVEARKVAFDDPGLEPNSVDRVVIVNTWHHIRGRVEYTKKLVAALKPGGSVAIIDYTKEAPRGPPAKHRLTADEVVAELEAGGLTAKVLDEDLPLQYIVIGTAPAN